MSYRHLINNNLQLACWSFVAEEVSSVLDTNVKGAFNMSRWFLPAMIKAAKPATVVQWVTTNDRKSSFPKVLLLSLPPTI
jgi:NADP-dependent 3-hydroxy acid dehydrogenase YdfG